MGSLEGAVVTRRPLLAYLALTFAISWGGVLLAVAAAGGVTAAGAAGTSPERDPMLPLEIAAMLGGPSVAGVAMTALVRGRAGLRELGARLLRWRVPVRWYAFALVAAPLVTLPVLLLLSLASPAFLPGIVVSDRKGALLLFGVAAGLAVGVLEELGWTGFALPELRRRHAPERAALLLGVAWGAWHVLTNDVLATGTWAGAAFPVALVVARGLGFLVGMLPAYRLLMTWVHERTKSLPVAMVMHAGLTASAIVLQPVALSGAALLFYDLLSGVAWWAAIAGAAAAKRDAEREPAPGAGVDATRDGRRG